jgi:hypothetical protein
MSMIPRCVTCGAPVDAYGRDGAQCGQYHCKTERKLKKGETK